MKSVSRRVCLACLLLMFCRSPLKAGDWPQILGPNRNGVADGEKLNFDWPAAGPPAVWTSPLGAGFAGVAVRENRAIAFHRVQDRDIVQAFDATTGKVLWKTGFETNYVPSVTYDNGPRCVPTLVGDRAIVYGSGGGLHCLNLKTGKTHWSVKTHEIYRADEGYFGAGSSPLVVDNRVIVNVGGTRTNAGLVAFSLADGTELWKATSEGPSYSSPILVRLGKQQAAIAVTRMSCVAVDPASGTVLFSFPFGKRGPTVNAANPLMVRGNLFLTASYGIGAVFGTPTVDGFRKLWTSDEVLSSQYTTCIADGEVLYGVHGRQDTGVPSLRCFDPQSRIVHWDHPLESYATLIRADGHLLVVTVGGDFIAVKLDRNRYAEVARASVVKPTPRGSALPALSNGFLYVRDAEQLKCLDLRVGRID